MLTLLPLLSLGNEKQISFKPTSFTNFPHAGVGVLTEVNIIKFKATRAVTTEAERKRTAARSLIDCG